MASFRFRLVRVLDWYDKQYRIEESRLRICAEEVNVATAILEQHRAEVLARRTELVHSPSIPAHEMAALTHFRRRAKQRDADLMKMCSERRRALDLQRSVTHEARLRLRLVEKLKERRLADHTYETNRQLEELASESHLASFARTLTNLPDSLAGSNAGSDNTRAQASGNCPY